jgi:hypothetical protein
MCEILDSNCGVAEDSSILGCDAVYLDEGSLTFQGIILPSSSGQSSPKTP